MKIDLFDLVEGLFEGTLDFFYNVLGTAWTVVTSPFAGPEVLVTKRAAARAQPAEGAVAKRQIGGVTFLFFWFLVFILVTAYVPGGLVGPEAPFRMLRTPGEVDLAPVWPALVGALAAAAIVDVALRGFRLALLRGESDTARDETVNRAEYALILPLLALAILTWLLGQAVAWLGGAFPTWLYVPMFIGVVVANFLFAIPAARQVCSGRLNRLIANFALNGLIAAALIAGLAVAASLHARAAAAETPAASAHAPPPPGSLAR
jgi:Flp pilus assembly pilin Flp